MFQANGENEVIDGTVNSICKQKQQSLVQKETKSIKGITGCMKELSLCIPGAEPTAMP